VDLSRLKELNTLEEILSTINKASYYGGDVWQAQDGQEKGKHLSCIKEILYDEANQKVILKLSSWISLNIQAPLYVKLNYRRTIFKILPGSYSVLGNEVFCNVPEEIHALETRKGGDRYVITPQSGISLSLKKIERNLRELTHELEVRIVDVSRKGFGIIISGQNRDYFKENDSFWLRAVNHQPLRTPILGTVSYICPQKGNQKKGEVRIGLNLSIPLDQNIFEELKKKSLLTLTA